MVSILVTTLISILLNLINLGSSTVLNDIISLAINSCYGSYFISASLLLWRRCTGSIKDPSPVFAQSVDDLEKADGALVWGPWRLRGWFGIVNNAWACTWMLIILFFTSWPSSTPVTPATMNYSIFITLLVAGVSGIYYIVWAKRTYTGPIIEV